MKKFLLMLLLVGVVFSSCNSDEPKDRFQLALLPVQEVVIPDSFELGETYSIKMKYHRPTSCHAFNGVYFDKKLNVRTVAVQTMVFEYDNCIPVAEGELVEASFDFYVTNNGSYFFKFWNGRLNGEDVFLEYEIPVN